MKHHCLLTYYAGTARSSALFIAWYPYTRSFLRESWWSERFYTFFGCYKCRQEVNLQVIPKMYPHFFMTLHIITSSHHTYYHVNGNANAIKLLLTLATGVNPLVATRQTGDGPIFWPIFTPASRHRGGGFTPATNVSERFNRCVRDADVSKIYGFHLRHVTDYSLAIHQCAM